MATSLDVVLQLLKETGSGKTTSTSTKETSMSPEGMQALVQKAMENVQGLSAVSGMQKQAGMYNSTVNSMLTNDFLTRIAAEAQANNKKETVTNTATNPGALSGKRGKNAAVLGALMSANDKFNLTDKIGDLFTPTADMGGFFTPSSVFDIGTTAGWGALSNDAFSDAFGAMDFGSFSPITDAVLGGLTSDLATGVLGDIGGDVFGSIGTDVIGNSVADQFNPFKFW